MRLSNTNRRDFLVNAFKLAGGGILGLIALKNLGISDAEAKGVYYYAGETVESGGACTPDCSGSTIIAGTNDDLDSTRTLNTSYWFAIRVQASSTATAECIKVRVNDSNSGESSAVGWALFDNAANDAGDDDDMPGDLLASGSNASHTWTDGATLNEFALDSCISITSGNLYWIALHFDGSSSVLFEGSLTGAVEKRYIAGAYDTPPSNQQTWSVPSDDLYSWSLTGD